MSALSRCLGLSLAILAAGCSGASDAGPDAAVSAAADAGSIAASDAATPGAGDAASPGAGDAAAPGPDAGDVHIQYCLDKLNGYRAQAGAAALALDPDLNAFALAGSQELLQDHTAHKHFQDDASQLFALGFHTLGENQGDANGWLVMDEDAAIDQILQAMMNEGPGGGHHDNILSTSYSAVGVGLVEDPSGRLYFTNDFGGY